MPSIPPPSTSTFKRSPTMLSTVMVTTATMTRIESPSRRMSELNSNSKMVAGNENARPTR